MNYPAHPASASSALTLLLAIPRWWCRKPRLRKWATMSSARLLTCNASAARSVWKQASPPTLWPTPTISALQAAPWRCICNNSTRGFGSFRRRKSSALRRMARFKIRQAVGVSVNQDVAVAPRLTVLEAVRKAAEHVGSQRRTNRVHAIRIGEPLTLSQVDLTGFTPRIITTFQNQPEQATVLDRGPFAENIKAQLTWFALDGGLRLAWQVLITLPDYAGQYRTLVDAETGEILYCHQLVRRVIARGNVYRADGASARQMTNFPKI